MWRSFLECGYSELISSGGDSRLALGPDGRNAYGSRCQVRDEIAFSSCSGSSPSSRCMAAAETLIVALRSTQTPKWIVADAIESVRRVLRSTMELSEDAEIALTPSGTASTLLAIGLADREPTRPLLHLLVGPREIGHRTVFAGSGNHYDRKVPRGGSAEPGNPVDRDLSRRIDVQTIDIRDSSGTIRLASDLDAELQQCVSEAVEAGYRVLVHAVAHSKTGLFAPRLETLNRIHARLPNDVIILVDAAQGRLGASFGTVAAGQLVAQGWMVHTTGSKFFGGPPTSGALIVPRRLRVRERRHGLPLAFGNYFSRAEMPKEWTAIRQSMDSWINVPAIVRWAAAIAEINSYQRIPAKTRSQILHRFEQSARRYFADQKGLAILPSFDSANSDWSDGSFFAPSSVMSIQLENGNRIGEERVLAIQRSLSVSNSIQLGTPVEVAPNRWALRLALGAPMMTRVANDLSVGETIETRMSWLDSILLEVAERTSAANTAKPLQIA
ncbi:MAG: hypothetical protein AAFU85_23065 [Planctomycetota bacterium]